VKYATFESKSADADHDTISGSKSSGSKRHHDLHENSILRNPSTNSELHKSVQPKSIEFIPVDAELAFFRDYAWTLNPIPTVRETINFLGNEITQLRTAREGWQVRELMTNIFLLSCSVLNSIDDYTHGTSYRVPSKALRLPFADTLQKVLRVFEASTTIVRSASVGRARRWKQRWIVGFDAFLRPFVDDKPPQPEVLGHVASLLFPVLRQPLPADLLAQHIRIPSAFRKRDLTANDIIALGRKFISHHPNRQQRILIVGLRTAGSYFAPMLRAYLGSEGYQLVDMVTIRPKKDLAASERSALARCAREQYMAVVIDDPPFSGGTIGLGIEHIRRAGFQSDKIVTLYPLRRIDRDLHAQIGATNIVDKFALYLEPDEWYKHRVLSSEIVESRLREYFLQRNFTNAVVIPCPEADGFNTQLQNMADIKDGARLKRIFAVRLETQDGRLETRFVLAKGVGWGWFGYSAFLAGLQLAGFVPPMLGLRDGILYMEWLPQSKIGATEFVERTHLIEKASEYVAARVASLGLSFDPTSSLGLDSQHEGYRIFSKTLCKAYGHALTAKLMESRVRQQLSQRISPSPTFIDGKMARSEWISSPFGMLKTDFEHHGFGKDELNVCDPAYDLADTVLQFGLSAVEEQELVRQYVAKTGDTSVNKRLLFNKLLAGIWSLESSLNGLKKHPCRWAAELDQQYIRAGDFLARECARFCGNLCHRPRSLHWHSPLVVLDVDGVLDCRMFGFPTTTAAGIRALRCIHAHNLPVAINTARSAREVKEYCSAYGFVGGVAEYGSYVYDAVTGRGQSLVTSEALEQLEELRRALKHVPDIFLNGGYEYSIRAYVYEGNGMAPLPNELVPNLISRLKLNRLVSYQTTIDTTIAANEVEMGGGLNALLSFVGHPDLSTVVIRGSSREIGHPELVRAVGGQIARAPAQRGLLELVRFLIHPHGGDCRSCPSLELDGRPWDDLFLNLLETADKKRSLLLLRALLRPGALRALVKS
jgi:hypothetical protein